MLGPNP
ncbi:hypothetical protein Zm00014a_030786 [Zea mays]|nr:hypothetical protein Zm00014a_030786 [Zea mays]